MGKRFIVLIDFSSYSGDLLKYAYDWSKKAGGKLVLAHNTTVVAPALADTATRAMLGQATNEEAVTKMRALAEKILPASTDILYVASEQPLASIISDLQAEPFDNLFFLGVKGTGRLKQIFLGSFVIDMIEHANSIVVAMPRHVTEFVSERIYVAVGSTSQLNTAALDTLLTSTGGRIREVSFFSLMDSKYDLHAMEGYLSGLTRDYSDRVSADYKVYHGKDVYDNIRNIINSDTNDLLVIQRGSKHLTHRPFRKFIINELVYAGETPLIVLP